MLLEKAMPNPKSDILNEMSQSWPLGLAARSSREIWVLGHGGAGV